MEQERVFAARLEKLKQTAKNQGFWIEEEKIQEAFADMEFSADQLALVIEYLKANKIGVGEPLDSEGELTEEERDYLTDYMESLPQFASDGEREALTLSAMAGERQAQNLLLERYLLHVVEIAKLYTGQGVFLEDLVGEGNVAAAVAVTMLGCLEAASEAEGMIGKMVMDAMEALIEENNTNQEADQKAAELVNQVQDQARELAESYQRLITVEELAQETDCTAEQIREAIRISGGQMEFVQQDT